MTRQYNGVSWSAMVALALLALGGLSADARAQENAAPQPAANTAPTTPPGLLAASCANCHGYEGRGAWPIAAIAGRPATELYRQLTAFRDGDAAVDATVMGRLMAGYSDNDIRALADWFAAQPAAAQ